MRLKLSLSVAVVTVLLTGGAQAAQVTVADPWFRALPAGLPAGGYVTLTNSADSPAVLTGAASPACGMIMLHQSIESGGMSRMEHVDGITVPAHGSATLAPGGYHLMCMQPKADQMKPGSAVPVTLEFADGTKMTASFAVKNARGQ